MGDTPSYLNPIESLLKTGSYLPDFRMPGYSGVYLLFRLIGDKAMACNLIIISQLLLAIMAAYSLALMAKMLFKSNRAFYICFYLFLISTYSNFYDAYLLTESFCASALVFAAYYLVLWFQSAKPKYLLFSGIFITWAIFLRPVFMPILLLMAFILIVQLIKNKRSWAKPLITLLLPFLLADGTWVTRNYINHKQFIPLTSSALYPEAANSYVQPLFEFVQSWGASTNYSDAKSALSWFDFYLPGMVKPDHFDTIPNYIYTTRFNRDSLVYLKQLVHILQNKTLDSNKAKAVQTELVEKLHIYTRSIAREKPFLYYIRTPLKLTKTFLYGPETKEYLKRGKVFHSLGTIIIAFNTLFYLAVLVLGLIGALLLIFRAYRESYLYLLFALLPIYVIVVHPMILRYAVNRFLMPSWPFLLVCATFTLLATYNRLSKPRSA
jgi:hypothetical protein